MSPRMTTLTVNGQMATCELEIRAAMKIRKILTRLKGESLMASFAVESKLATVNIRVAISATIGHSREVEALMTVGAGEGHVPALKRQAIVRMNEAGRD